MYIEIDEDIFLVSSRNLLFIYDTFVFFSSRVSLFGVLGRLRARLPIGGRRYLGRMNGCVFTYNIPSTTRV